MSKNTERTKVVVRRLPPLLKEEDFKEQADKVCDGTYNWFRFSQGKQSPKREIFSRVYLNFNSAKAASEFKSKFEGIVFLGPRGRPYRCLVEFAPYQRIPKQRSKVDKRGGTLYSLDPDYLEFVENLDKAPVMLPSAQRQYEEQEAMKLATGEGDDDIVNTPLMEAVIQKYLNENSKQNSKRGMRESKSGRSSRNKPSNSKATPKIIIHPRPDPKFGDADKNKGASKGRRRRGSKIKEGHQAWVPKIMKSEDSKTMSPPAQDREKADNYAVSETRSEDSRGRGRGRRRSGRSRSAGAKIAWREKSVKRDED